MNEKRQREYDEWEKAMRKHTKDFIINLYGKKIALSLSQQEEIERLRVVLNDMLSAIEQGGVEITSSCVSRNTEIPPLPWHEEWIYRAKKALEKGAE